MTKKEMYQKIIDADDLHKALVEGFSFLADTDGFMPVLDAVMKRVKSVEIKDDGYGRDAIYLHFPGVNEPALICGEYENQNCSDWPDSFQQIAASCMYIIFPDDSGWALQLGVGNLPQEEFEDNIYDKVDNGAILSPLTDFSDWWIYHPTRKNPQGEPLLCLVSHESCNIVDEVSFNIGSLFLKRVQEVLDIEGDDFDKAEIIKKVEQVALGAGIGATDTIFKHDCDYALYVCKEEGKAFFNCMVFYPVGEVTQYIIWDDLSKSVIKENIADLENCYDNGHGQYTVLAGGTKVESVKQGDRISLFGEMDRICGWKNNGELIMVNACGEDISVFTYCYIGYVKDGEVVFDENCGLGE